MSVHPQVQWYVLLPWRAGDSDTLDGPRKHHRVFGEARRCGSVTSGKRQRSPQRQSPLHFVFYRYQLLGVVKGVRYLHDCNIAHGDIKPVSPLALTDGPIVKIYLVSSRTSSFQTPLHHDPCLQT